MNMTSVINVVFLTCTIPLSNEWPASCMHNDHTNACVIDAVNVCTDSSIVMD